MKFKILSSLINFLAHFFNIQKKYIFFIPDVYNDLIDESLSNYTSQNPFIILREILHDDHFDSYKIIYQYNSESELLRAKNSVKELGAIDRFIFLEKNIQSLQKTISLVYFAFQSKLILSTSPLIPYQLKHNKQIHIALNYYSPFKSDIKWKLESNSIDYVVSTSMFASYIDSQTSSIPINQYKILGFPRNDYLINPRFSKEEIFKKLDFDTSKNYFLYLPTHRVGNVDDSNDGNLVVGINDNNYLDALLGDINSVLVIKGHINNYSNELLEYKNIMHLPTSSEITVYDVMPHMDGFLLDYSSIYFDILLLNKKIIFNFIDYKLYEQSRGFSFDNIEDICFGDIAYDKKSLIQLIKNSAEHSANLADSAGYDFIVKLAHKYRDSNSTNRVLNFIKEVA